MSKVADQDGLTSVEEVFSASFILPAVPLASVKKTTTAKTNKEVRRKLFILKLFLCQKNDS